MASDKDVGEFLLRELFRPHEYDIGYAENVCKCWAIAGELIERMREREFGLHGSDATQTMGPYWAFHAKRHGECEVNETLSPRTIALAAALELGMEVDDGR